MSIKLLGGMAKGFTLATPQDSITRPTSVLLKRRLFDYFQHLDGFTFIDLCAGSGSIGLEALSRGAQKAILIEGNVHAYRVLETNVKSFKNKFPDAQVESVKSMIEKWIPSFFEQYQKIQDKEKTDYIIFFDPPYENIQLYEYFFKTLNQFHFKGLAIIEACRQKTMPESDFIAKFGAPERNYQQGTSFLYLYDYNKY